MAITEIPNPVTATGAYRAAEVAANADFDTRWAAWIERGRVHEQKVRRRFLIWLPVIAIAVAVAFVLFRS